MNREQLLTKYSDPIKVGSGGFVKLVDVMGDDHAIANAARISYGDGTKTINEDIALVRRLLRDKHWSPFEMCELKLHIKLPIYVMRQLIRHKSASINEYSQRYSLAIDEAEVTDAESWRLQSKSNKQGSEGTVQLWTKELLENEQFSIDSYDTPGIFLSASEKWIHDRTKQIYDERIALGVAREQARKDLPVSTYTEVIWKNNLRGTLHTLGLRLDEHAQLEIRQFAQAIAQIVSDWVPATWSAYEDFEINAFTLSGPEMHAFEHLLPTGAFYDLCDMIEKLSNMHPTIREKELCEYGLITKSERIDFIKKLKRLVGYEDGDSESNKNSEPDRGNEHPKSS